MKCARTVQKLHIQIYFPQIVFIYCSLTGKLLEANPKIEE